MTSRIFKFHEVFADEIVQLNARRSACGRGPVALEEEAQDRDEDGDPILRPTEGSNVVGLALSGGGVRSASFCLGALQALENHGVLDKVDYLSTVSGGGYIGASMSAARSVSADGGFPFRSELRQDEPPGLQHIRDHSNYLFPQGTVNFLCNVVVYLRGLVANALLIVPVLLLAAAATIYSNPEVAALKRTDAFGAEMALPIRVSYFGITLNALLAFVVLLAAWALWRSRRPGAEVGTGCSVIGLLALAIVISAFCELQPVVVDGMFELHEQGGGISASFVDWMTSLAAVLAPFAAVVGFLGRSLANVLKRSEQKPGWRAASAKVLAKLAMYLAGAAVPLVLWVAYLYFSFWGICNPRCAGPVPHDHAPGWILDAARRMFGEHGTPFTLYLAFGVALLVIGSLLSPNANSLHRLYRDRLSKAFLFNPDAREAALGVLVRVANALRRIVRLPPSVPSPDRMQDLAALDRFKLSEIDCRRTPYHIINAALNISGSKSANRRGRNAEFFIFSPRFVGSDATNYVSTEAMQARFTHLDLGTAMAISGAAASSNMGANTIKPLVPTLAILNVRLGYWLINPVIVATGRVRSTFLAVLDKFYFLNELFGLLREDSDVVYLTDGGHIENLGLYELLRRRCRVIIAVDAEADADMAFGSLVTLQRYARIDLGTRIDLPWASIRDCAKAASDEIAGTGGLPPDQARHGPHCAIGEIIYPRGRSGVLIYVKSSVSGDESDYIVDYKRRYPEFPHETTADQLFSEEQFEAYRALGFHVVQELLEKHDEVGMRPKPAVWAGDALNDPLVKTALDILQPRPA